MKSATSVIKQLISLIPKEKFKSAVALRGTEKYSKGFSSWDHFIAMLFAQISGASSLRDIVASLASDEGRASQLFMDKIPTKSTLAYANEHRGWQLFEDGFYILLEEIQKRLPKGQKEHIFKFGQKMFSLDSSVITLCLDSFDWAKYRSSKGGIKIHTLLDHDYCLPALITVTPANVADITEARKLSLPKGSILVMDRGYFDYSLFKTLDDSGITVVSRSKSNMAYEVIDSFKVPAQRPGRPSLASKNVLDGEEGKDSVETLEVINSLDVLDTLRGLEKLGLLSAIPVLNALKALPPEKAKEALTALQNLEVQKARKAEKAKQRQEAKAAKAAKKALKEKQSKGANAEGHPENTSSSCQSPIIQEPQEEPSKDSPATLKQPLKASATAKKSRKKPKYRQNPKNKSCKPRKNTQKPENLEDIPLFIVLTDQLIRLNHTLKRQQNKDLGTRKPEKISELRQVTVLVMETNRNKPRIMQFITNNKKLSANTISMIYQQRWRIETFFKTLKQNLVIKTFLGTSENAVKCQIFAAMTAILLIKFLQVFASSKVNWNFSNLFHIVRQNFFCYFDICVWVLNNDPDKRPPPDVNQLSRTIAHNKLF
jgi:hypothetical protein